MMLREEERDVGRCALVACGENGRRLYDDVPTVFAQAAAQAAPERRGRSTGAERGELMDGLPAAAVGDEEAQVAVDFRSRPFKRLKHRTCLV
jgi:hypothetical protein